MAWLRRRLAAWSVSPLGWLAIALIPVCALLTLVGPKAVQTPALIVGLLVLALVASEGAGVGLFSLNRSRGGLGSITGVGSIRSERREPPSGAGSATSLVSAPVEADEAAWQAERERRERDSAG
jgi:hypothetical protein